MTMPIASAGTVQPGTWGSNGAVLTTSAAQTRIDVGTGIAVVSGPLKTDAAGRFKTVATFEAYRPGPQSGDQPPMVHKAQVSGRARGGTVELTMQVDGERAVRKFLFTKRRVAKLIRPM